MIFQGNESPSQFICNIVDRRLGLIGHLVIDSTIDGKSWGGVRILPDITLTELTHSARTMTLKFGFLGIPVGGAKAGIFADPSLPIEKRMEILRAFGESISPLLKSRLYFVGVDMGASPKDIEIIRYAAGLRTKLSNNENKSHLYTSWTMLASAKEATKNLGMEISDCTVAIEGFGNVGSAAAHVFSESGASIVAISTKEGAIYDPQGLQVNELLEIKKRVGDRVVRVYQKARRIEKAELLSLPVDILAPCAGPWSINFSNVERLRSKIICPGANVPMDSEIEEILFNRKVMCFPDFVANSGGAFGSWMEEVVSEEKIHEIINKEYSRKVQEVIKLSEECNISPGKIARDIAEKRLRQMKSAFEQKDPKGRLFLTLLKAVRKKPLGTVIRPLAPLFFTKMLHSGNLSR